MSKNQTKSSTYCTQFCFNYFQFTPALYVNSQVSVYVLLICFFSILPVVPTERDVLIVGNIMTIIVQFTIEHQAYYDWKLKEQHAKIWENIAGAKRYSRPRGFNIAGASAGAPSIPTPLSPCDAAGDDRNCTNRCRCLLHRLLRLRYLYC